MRRAQIISLDLVSGVVLFLAFTGLFLLLFFIAPRYGDQPEFEFEALYVFDNLEENLEGSANGTDFLRHYRVDAQKLAQFASQVRDIDPYLLEGSGGSYGVGLLGDAYDACLYFTDNDLSFVPIGALVAIGELRGATCHDRIAAGENPCDGYRQAVTTFRPVLFNEGSVDRNRILQMNMVACKR